MADTLSCQWETLHSQQLRSIKKSIDSDHGIYRHTGGTSSRSSAARRLRGRSRRARRSGAGDRIFQRQIACVRRTYAVRLSAGLQ